MALIPHLSSSNESAGWGLSNAQRGNVIVGEYLSTGYGLRFFSELYGSKWENTCFPTTTYRKPEGGSDQQSTYKSLFSDLFTDPPLR